VHQRFGPIDILVNNAGVSPKRRSPTPWITQVALDEWRRVIDVNLTGAWLCSRAAAADMIARRWGRIVNIGSIAGRTTPKIAGPHYAAAKAGLAGLTPARDRSGSAWDHRQLRGPSVDHVEHDRACGLRRRPQRRGRDPAWSCW
jgi:3-oxoacyl-[acyl-carrier protein] reductase